MITCKQNVIGWIHYLLLVLRKQSVLANSFFAFLTKTKGVIFTKFWADRKLWRGRATPLYNLYTYVPPQRVWFLSRFGLKTGIDFDHYGLKSGMVFKGTTGAYKCICLLNSKWIVEKEKYPKCIQCVSLSWILPIVDFVTDAKLNYGKTKVWKRFLSFPLFPRHSFFISLFFFFLSIFFLFTRSRTGKTRNSSCRCSGQYLNKPNWLQGWHYGKGLYLGQYFN